MCLRGKIVDMSGTSSPISSSDRVSLAYLCLHRNTNQLAMCRCCKLLQTIELKAVTALNIIGAIEVSNTRDEINLVDDENKW